MLYDKIDETEQRIAKTDNNNMTKFMDRLSYIQTGILFSI